MGRTRLTKAELEFARSLAPHVLWARRCNNDEPSPHLTLEQQLAIALILQNEKYIDKWCSSPAYMAYNYVCKGRTREHGDRVEWIKLIRDAVEGFNRESE
ncbi:hypothetical protein [Actinoallomurus sp. CA-142502]|uniref:hypothetical protein n=1 Tax=Actinoallomurus sp. CA-142502 TaxID=3239885 RepID=UPI003D92B4F6